MRISLEKLALEAEATGFRPDFLEKVARLLGLLNAIKDHPFLKDKLVLKGGTALNLFIFNVPRLSVDIDMNYVGAEDREIMLIDRPKVEQALRSVFMREGYFIRRMPDEHAGGKWTLRYENATGMHSNLEVDINFMFRLPLWPVTIRDSHSVGAWQAKGISVLDQHELAAGKLAALLARKQIRDLYDSHKVFHIDNLDSQRLRIGFVVYGAMNRKDWRSVSVNDVDFDSIDLTRQLIPTLRVNSPELMVGSTTYGNELAMECRKALSVVLPFTDSEKAFLDLLLDQGEIDPTLLTNDPFLQQRILLQPLLKWKAINVRRHKL